MSDFPKFANLEGEIEYIIDLVNYQIDNLWPVAFPDLKKEDYPQALEDFKISVTAEVARRLKVQAATAEKVSLEKAIKKTRRSEC